MRLSAEAGGGGMSLFDACLMMEQAGRRLAPAPLAESVVALRMLGELGGDVAPKLDREGPRRRDGAHARTASGAQAGQIAARAWRRRGQGCADLRWQAGRDRDSRRTAGCARDPRRCGARRVRAGQGRASGHREQRRRGADLGGRDRGVEGAHVGRPDRPLAGSADDGRGLRLRADRLRPADRRQPGHRPSARRRRDRRRRRRRCCCGGPCARWRIEQTDAARQRFDVVLVGVAHGDQRAWRIRCTPSAATASPTNTIIQLYHRRAKAWPLALGDPQDELVRAGRRLLLGEQRRCPGSGPRSRSTSSRRKAARRSRRKRVRCSSACSIRRSTSSTTTRSTRHDWEVHRALGEARLLFPDWPEKWGGRGADADSTRASLAVWQEVGYTAPSRSVDATWSAPPC